MARKVPNMPDDVKAVPINETAKQEENVSTEQPLQIDKEALPLELTADEAAMLVNESEEALRGIGEEQLEPSVPFDISAQSEVETPFAKTIEPVNELNSVQTQEVNSPELDNQEQTAPVNNCADKPPEAEKAEKPGKEPRPEKQPKADKSTHSPNAAAEKEAAVQEEAPPPPLQPR